MPKRRPDNYLKTHRESASLTQAELGQLVGCVKQTISRYELSRVKPSLRFVIACELLFGLSVYDLFPVLAEAVEDDVAATAAQISAGLEGKADSKSKKKAAFLLKVPGRTRFPR